MSSPTYYLWTKNYRDFQIRTTDTHETVKTFQHAKAANKALPGDIVAPTDTGCTLVSRAKHYPIAGLLELNSKVKYGFTARNSPIYLFSPYNEAYPPFVVGCSEKDTSVNRSALITFDHWTDTYPRGNLVRLLVSDTEALFWTHSPAACQPYKGPFPEPPKDLHNRPHLPPTTFHIDPPGCQDVDDVLSIEHTPTDTYITITIADVAASIAPDSPLDLRAQVIAQTFYQATSNRPMFPHTLSEDALSLKPGPNLKAGLSLRFSLSDPTNYTLFESAVNTAETYTYESIYQSAHVPILKQMATALDSPSDDSHEWIEAAMKFYNTTAAKLLKQHNAGLLRAHTAPDAAKLQTYTEIDPSLTFLAYSAATYVKPSHSNTHHWGLSAMAYCHASSPIRRYADLINQRALKAILMQAPPQPSPDPATLNRVSKAAKQHDRDYIFLCAIQRSSTDTVQGKIIDITITATNPAAVKLSVYVPSWSLVVKLHYATGPSPGTVMSKDEKTVNTVCLGQHVVLSYNADLKARSWKKRMVLRLCAASVSFTTDL